MLESIISKKNNENYLPPKRKEKDGIRKNTVFLMGAGTGLEPATSGL